MKAGLAHFQEKQLWYIKSSVFFLIFFLKPRASREGLIGVCNLFIC